MRAYLDAEALVRIAMASGCDCVHPGYGFLAENAAFAERCASAGLVFVGPLPATLSLFGDKLRARALAQSLEIPIVPGSAEALRSSTEASAQAGDLGYPVMLKASAGGGGRGMRQVENAEQLAEGFARCRSEAEAAFRDGSVRTRSSSRGHRDTSMQEPWSSWSLRKPANTSSSNATRESRWSTPSLSR